jgi:hypothetical protein
MQIWNIYIILGCIIILARAMYLLQKLIETKEKRRLIVSECNIEWIWSLTEYDAEVLRELLDK